MYLKNKEIEKSDDPIRMYLREMGGVELLSREGEIAIAKRIEAGKDYMINGLFQSPLAAQKVFEWKEKLENDKLLVREIIDIDSSYVEEESEAEGEYQNLKKNKQNEKKKINPASLLKNVPIALSYITTSINVNIRTCSMIKFSTTNQSNNRRNIFWFSKFI